MHYITQFSHKVPVCVLRCADRDFSRGKTRWQNLHFIDEGEVEPSIMRLVNDSDRGRPRLCSLPPLLLVICSTPSDTVDVVGVGNTVRSFFVQVGVFGTISSGEPHEELGLSTVFIELPSCRGCISPPFWSIHQAGLPLGM